MKRLILILIAFVFSVQVLFSLIKLIRTQDLNDFGVYYQAAQTSLSGNPYTGKYFAPYNYPPSATLFFLSLTVLSYKLCEGLWLAASIFALFFSVFLLFKLFFKKKLWVYTFFVGALLLRTFPSRFTLVLGQINLIILLFMILSFFFYQKRRKSLAGLFLGIASALKLTPLMLTLFYLFKKEKKSFLIPLLFFSATNLLSGVLLGFDNFFYYFKVVLPLLMQGDISRDIHVHYFNQSLEAFLFDLGLVTFWRSLIRWFVVGLLVIFVGKRIMAKNKPLKDFKFFSALLIIFSTFSSSFTWSHHYVFLFPALLALFLSLKKKPSIFLAFLCLFFWLSFTFYFKDSSSPSLLENPFLRSHTFFSGVALFITLLVI